ncbi:transposase, IS4 [Deinococcus aerius]|uniref:Transposase, IS4 n=1 Tax=Deinococcus aerius TaxID=200253 RepID=A0A2I9D595_9DEIO|nr:IS5 family transposase [Deinococcus aerius]GBF05500.1 transposase, IS4 [Deinococcus aerius]
MTRRGYPSDADDDTYLFLPYLLLSPEDARQREYAVREVLNALGWVARTGAPWAYLPHDFPPAETVCQQAHRWFEAGCFENAAHDLRVLSRVERSRNGEPTAIIIDSRTLQSTPESGHRAGFDGAKKRKGTKVHLAVDTLGHLLAVLTTPAHEQDRAQVKDLCLEVQEATGVNVEVAFVDQGYTGERTALEATEAGVDLVVVKRPGATKGFILLPRRWVVERSFAWLSRFRSLGRDLERLPSTLVGFHFLAAGVLLCNNPNPLFA